MPTTISIPNTRCVINCDSIVDECETGSADAQANIVIYDGTPPTNVDTALSGNTVLAELEMSTTAFNAAAEVGQTGEAAAAAITDDSSANATGTASFFRILNRDNLAIIQGTVGTSGEVLNLNSVAISSGAVVEITALTMAVPEA